MWKDAVRVTPIVILSITVSVAAACGGGSTTPTVVADVVSITSMSPASGTTLRPGQTVTFTGTTAYSLATANSGTVVLVIEDQANQILQPPGTQPSAIVAGGSGTVTLFQSITLPDTNITSVRVIFLLAPAGATSTRAAMSVTYPVQ